MPHDAKTCCHLLLCRLCQTVLLLKAGIKKARAPYRISLTNDYESSDIICLARLVSCWRT